MSSSLHSKWGTCADAQSKALPRVTLCGSRLTTGGTGPAPRREEEEEKEEEEEEEGEEVDEETEGRGSKS